MTRFRPTLAQTFLAANLCLAVLLGALLYGLSRGSEKAVLATSELLRRSSSRLIVERMAAYFVGAEQVVAAFQGQARLGLIDLENPKSVEAALFAATSDHPSLAGGIFTAAKAEGFAEDGRMQVAPAPRWQASVYREGTRAREGLQTAWVRARGRGFARELWRRPPEGPLQDAVLDHGASRSVDDPTEHPTFVTPASRPFCEGGTTIWSDLSFLEADRHLPEDRRRVLVGALRAVRDRAGRFAGVLGIGLRSEAVDRVVQEEQERARPNRIVLSDEQGRLVSRLSAADVLVEQDDESLRVVPRNLPPEIEGALRQEGLRQVSEERPEAGGRFLVSGRPYLATFRVLPRTQGWRIAVVVAEDELPGFSEQARRRRLLLAFTLFVTAVILAGGILTLRTVRRGLSQITRSSARLREFDFAAERPATFFRDVQGAMEALELAKTAMRAMSKYVPVDVVRLLYQTGREPELGGEPRQVSLLFSDIRGFTTIAERVSPNELARMLGRYFEVMAAAIQGCGGAIDKYVGDGIMAVWNAPIPAPGHPTRACTAALAAREAADRLFASAEWGGRPPLVTRFGLHTGEVLVGHFGAPDRLSYTCLGDGVNLAARLEGLNKQYGTTVMVSEAMRQAAGPAFEFRLLDEVAVSGKGLAVRVHELLGPAGLSGPSVERARRYEEAYALYRRREFVRALAGFVALSEDDPPAAALAERCRVYLHEPPPDGWDGAYAARVK